MPKVEIKLDATAFSKTEEQVRKAALAAMEALRGAILEAQIMPRDQGELEKSMGKPAQEIRDDEIVTTLAAGGGNAPYARRLYFHPEYNFQKVNNPNAQGKWLKPWLPSGESEGFLRDAFEQALEEALPK